MKRTIATQIIGGLSSLIIMLCWSGRVQARYPYNFPSHAKVEIIRNPDRRKPSWLYLEFMWSKDCPPNFEPGKAVEFEINIVPKCFVQPKDGADANHVCNEVLGLRNYHLPGGNDNCYVDVWNYFNPWPQDIGPVLTDKCDDLDWQGQACSFVGGLGFFSQDNGNFAVGLYDASQLKAGERYFFRYPVEIADNPICEKYEYYRISVGNHCAPLQEIFGGPHNDWGKAWVTMQTFNNRCDLPRICDHSDTEFFCPHLIGAVFEKHGIRIGCENADKHTDFWLNRLCVPTEEWAFTPGFGTLQSRLPQCMNEQVRNASYKEEIAPGATCCLDYDEDNYYTKQNKVMYGTYAGDCNDRNSSINPGVRDLHVDGTDQNCDGRDGELLATASLNCSNGIQDNGETGTDCGGNCDPCENYTPGPETLASGLTSPWDIALDASYVYWIEQNTPGALRRMLKSGGTVTTLATDLEYPTALTLANGYLYFIETDYNAQSRIRRIPLTGGTPELVVNTSYGAVQNQLRHDGTRLFFHDYDQIPAGMKKSAPLGANVTASVIVQDQDQLSLALDVDSTYLYFFNNQNRQILRVPKGGGPITVLGNGIANATRVFGSTLYFIADGVNAIPITGGTPRRLASRVVPTSLAYDLAVDGSHVYWIEYTEGGSVNRVPVGGGEVTTYSQHGNSIGIEVDNTHVYWAENWGGSAGMIRRALK